MINKNFFITLVIQNKIKFVFFIMAFQNMIIFHNHYFNDATPPWDFVETYLAVPFYWIELLRHGYDVSWVPFQGMGYPLYMNLQSGYYYLPNWIFVLCDIQYTINNAVIMQCIHILFGSLGAVLLAYLIGFKWYQALLAGFVYQTFGAFYSNAEHLDIIRGYSFIPWLLTPILTNFKNKKIDQIILYLLPFITLLMLTGGYLGMSISIFFVLGITIFLKIIFNEEYRKYGFFVIFTLIIGFLMASIFLLPSILDKTELIRDSGVIVYDYASLIDIFSLVFKVGFPSLPHDISMQSSSISLIIFMLLTISLFKFRILNKWLIFILLISILMISGVLHQYVIQIFPQLGLSRMIMSDYRALIGILIILIALEGMKDLNEKDFTVTLIITLLFLMLGNYFLNINTLEYKKEFFLILFSFLLSAIALYVFIKNKFFGIVFIFIVVLLDFYRIHSSQIYWNHKGALTYIENTFGEYRNFTNQLLLKANGQDFRKERIGEEKRPYSYKGYYDGSYMMNDYGASMHLKLHDNIRNNPILKSFALMKWTPIYGDIDDIKEENIKKIVDFVKLEKYKTSEIVYSFTTSKEMSFIENEIFWNGWEGKIIDEKGNDIQKIRPENINGFRKWQIPKGNYTLITNFNPPHQKKSIYLSLFGLSLWILFLYYLIRKKNK